AQASAIAAELRRARIERGIGYHEMAVVARAGAALAVIGRACAVVGVPVDLTGGDVVLADAQAVRPLLLALGVIARGEVLPEEAVRLLSSPLAGFDPVGLRHLVRQWRQSSPAAAGSGQVPGADEALAAAVNEPGWLPADAATVQQRRLGDLVALLAAGRAACLAGKRADEVAWLLWSGTRWPARLRAEALEGGPAGRHADRDLDAVGAFFELAAESSGTGQAGVRLLLDEIAAQEIPADRAREGRPGARGVQLLTAHRARGREWELVVVAGVQEGVWPTPRQLSAVLEPERLLSDGIGPRTEPRELLVSERRLFHLACSRARRELIVTATAGTEGEANQPSRFVAELGVSPERPEPGPPVTLTGLVGRLRRALLAADSPPQRRLAAAANLAGLAAEAADGSRLVPAADPRTWWGVRPVSSPGRPSDGPIRLSPSQVSGLLTCPRRYFLGRDAHAEGPPAVGASLGSVIHLLVEHAGNGGLDGVAAGNHLDAAWQHLRFETGWLSAVERVEAEVSIQRFLAWREQRPATAVAVEADFSLDLELDGRQVTLSGAVDRLERTADGRLTVIDFKTGRTLPTRDEVAGMDQLGIYQLAVSSGAFTGVIDSRPESAGAAVVYLRVAGRSEGLPKELAQDPLGQRPHLGLEPDEADYPSWVHHRVAKAAGIVAAGGFHASPGGHCRRCPFADSCPASGRGGQVLA
ncbi:MAG: PD-(D/E)XK nuclease family protein, partial [Propionicimonas sp.]